MPVPENLPRDVRPLRLSEAQVIQLARRTVYFPSDRSTTAGRFYKSDVRRALGHALAIEQDRDTQVAQHEQEIAALRDEIAALTAQLEAAATQDAPRVGDAGAAEPTRLDNTIARDDASTDVDEGITPPDTGVTL